MIRKSSLFLIILIPSIILGCLIRDDNDDFQVQNVKISGSVVFNGEPLEGVLITLGGDALKETATDSTGEYTFYGLERGNYVVKADLRGYEYSPESIHLIVDDEDLSGMDFEAYTENTPPELDPLPDVTIHQGQLIHFVVTAYDADGDQIVYSAIPLPHGATLIAEEGCAVFEWSPGAGAAGRYDITLSAVDDGIPGLTDSQTITITVLGDESSRFPFVESFSEKGPFSTISASQEGPNGAFSIYYPRNLGQQGLRHPIITWGNGTGAHPLFYAGLLTHWASHGFVVIAANTTMAGSGEEMLEGVDWLISENSREGSSFFNRINLNAVGASGHSQGGGGAINAGRNAKVKCIAPIQPAPGNSGTLKGPMFVIAGSSDTVISPALVERQVYVTSNVPTVFGILNGATHFTPLGSARGMRGYLTAWFRLHLMEDDTAWSIFYGDNCDICSDSAWRVERKGF